MLLVTNLDDLPPIDQPCGLTIGTFDGVHVGHQALLTHLRVKLPENSLVIVITFSNHPSFLLTPHAPISLICSPLQKVKYLGAYGADLVCLIPFTAEFADLSYKDFLKTWKARLGFSQLVFGQGAVLGKNREGTEMQIKQLSEQIHFNVDYLSKQLINGTPVSSRRIRELIQTAQFAEIAHCLGRPYSLMGGVKTEKKHFVLHFPGLCLPPLGTYAIRLRTHSQTFLAKAQITSDQRIILSTDHLLPETEVELIFT